jgi:hypothetical protein
MCREKKRVVEPAATRKISVSCDSKTINQQARGNDSLFLMIGHGLKVRRFGELGSCRRFFALFGA